MAKVCPLHKMAGMVCESIFQHSKTKDYTSWMRHPTIAAEAMCIRDGCQWWGYWQWAEEESQYSFVRKIAFGCTFGQSNCVQGDGATDF